VFFKKAIRKCLRWYINPMVDQQRNYNAAVTRLIDNINGKASAAENKLMDMEDVVSELQKDVDDISSRLLTLEDNVRWLNSIAQDGKEAAMVSAERLRRIEGALKKEGRIAMNAPINHTEREDVDIDYFLFEQIHRGSREQIKTSQEKYLKYFEDKDNILDIGCGRGEFIELLIENGKKNVRGIDVNDDMVLYCKELGLPVEKADAIEYLENIETGKIQGIYMGQVVEHLSPADMLYIIRLAYRKLAKDGVLIIETLNPRCLAIFSNAFYVDISHEKPVHPFTLEFIFQTEGFKNLEVIYMSEIKEKIPEIKDSRIVNVEEFNKAISRVNDLLFGYQDYAIIGRK
jgi:2-polyprenyl-3-methyl-5-hydroxy-6-metoxy-1,4-benzoquinol methylase